MSAVALKVLSKTLKNNPGDFIRYHLGLGLETTYFYRKSALQTGVLSFERSGHLLVALWEMKDFFEVSLRHNT